MNSQNKNTVTMGDVWEELTAKKIYQRVRETDNIILRLSQAKSGQIRFSLQIGLDICEMLNWKQGDVINIMRNKLNGVYLKLSKSNLDGLKLSSPNKNTCRLNLWGTLDFHKKYILDNTKPVNFELNKDYIVVDISNLCTDQGK